MQMQNKNSPQLCRFIYQACTRPRLVGRRVLSHLVSALQGGPPNQHRGIVQASCLHRIWIETHSVETQTMKMTDLDLLVILSSSTASSSGRLDDGHLSALSRGDESYRAAAVLWLHLPKINCPYFFFPRKIQPGLPVPVRLIIIDQKGHSPSVFPPLAVLLFFTGYSCLRMF